ncbi:MAG: hypothetical protein HYZ44_00565 [Bacteroidetes bacterium]|nr:hypothetical protein [Bacteroidota bacterium]
MKIRCSWMGVIGVCLTAGLFAQSPVHSTHNYHLPDSVAARYLNHSLADARSLALKLTAPFSTEHEKYRAIFRWVCANIRSDYQLYAKVKQLRKRYQSDPVSLAIWNQKINHQMYEQLREKRSTVCTGYAYLIRTLAEHAGIACQLVDGYARSSQANLGGPGIPNHSWNAVRIDSVWYLSDATWASGQVYGQDGYFIPNFNESYFLVLPATFVHSHYPLDTAHLFLSDKPALTDFLNAPLVYAASYDYALHAVQPTTFFMMVDKGENVQFKVKQEGGIPIHKLALHVNDGEVTSIEAGCDENESTYNLTHAFTSRGIVAVHVVADGRPVFSYRIRVR